ncbi:MAG: acetyl-CoA C-acetyltransferase [Desulfohalobiaceae bacterium]|nr:acetyl-CoA C-acetyltransferase [Desulfohalobiaceae bacterium]
MREVVIAGYLRTAQSRSRPDDPSKDCFHRLRADELLARLLPEVIERTGLDPGQIDDFLVGSALGVSEQWTFGGRNPLFLADLPNTIAAKFIDQQCGSSMACVHVAFMEIATGVSDVVLAGGMEHMTRVPMNMLAGGSDIIAQNPRLFEDERYRHWDMPTAVNMGLTAEKIFSRTDFTREDLDRWGARSHELAMRASENGFFSKEILPIEVEKDDGGTTIIDRDQSVRSSATAKGMAGLKPVFRENGVITAGNSSPLNAGASSMVLMAKEKARAEGITPLATIRSIGFAGVDPTIMGHGPVPASRKALSMAGLTAGEIDFWEINEAFCIVALNCIKELNIQPEKVNVMGGATAIGHPLGATGIRLVGTLARILETRQCRYGCANACCGGGQGVATIIERETYDC